MERQRITQAYGPTLKFTGKLIADTEFRIYDGLMVLEVWKTQGAAYIAASTKVHDDTGNEERRATVIKPTFTDGGTLTGNEDDMLDKATMHRQVMDAFDWHDQARSMVRKQLKWNLNWEID